MGSRGQKPEARSQKRKSFPLLASGLRLLASLLDYFFFAAGAALAAAAGAAPLAPAAGAAPLAPAAAAGAAPLPAAAAPAAGAAPVGTAPSTNSSFTAFTSACLRCATFGKPYTLLASLHFSCSAS